MKTYDKYKASRIDWIGEIPAHWDVKRLKYAISYQKGKNPKELKSIESESSEIYLAMDYLRDSSKSVFYVENPEEYVQVNEDNILLLWDGSNAGEFMKGKKGVLSSTMAVLDLKLSQNNFTFYFLKSFEKYLKESTIGMGIPHVNGEELKNSLFVIPSKEEQTAIATYLDHKTAQIDSIIANKQKLIALYEEEKQTIINQAVTKGLNKDAKLKPSGVEWLGEIPEHWKVKKLKYFAQIVLGKMLTNDDKGGYTLKPYLRAANLNWLNVDVADVKEMWFSDSELERLRINRNDILVSEGGEIGRACIWQNELEECFIQNSVHKVTILHEYSPAFFLYQFLIYGKRGYFDSIVNRISIAHLTNEKIKEVEFIVPPKEEQFVIVNYIEEECTRLDNLIEKFKSQIDLFQEYRSTLISEVVTGKVKVIE